MDDTKARAVADAVRATFRSVEAVHMLYRLISGEAEVRLQQVRGWREIFGLGRQVARSLAVSAKDYSTTSSLVQLIESSHTLPLDERMNISELYAREGFTRARPKPVRPLKSKERLAFCFALDIGVLMRLNMAQAFSAITLDMAYDSMQEGDIDGQKVINMRLALDTTAPVGIAVAAARVAFRALIANHRDNPIPSNMF